MLKCTHLGQLGKYICILQSVELYDIGPDLKSLIDNSSNNKIDYVAIRGVVKSLGESLRSINKENVTGVIQKFTVSEHVIARTSTGFW